MAEKTKEQWQKESEEFYKKVDENFEKELVPLNRDEAIAEMKKGNHLQNGVDPAHMKKYTWEGPSAVTSNSWEYDFGGGVPIATDDLPQLYEEMWRRKTDGKLFEWAEVRMQLFGY